MKIEQKTIFKKIFDSGLFLAKIKHISRVIFANDTSFYTCMKFLSLIAKLAKLLSFLDFCYLLKILIPLKTSRPETSRFDELPSFSFTWEKFSPMKNMRGVNIAVSKTCA